MVENTFSMNEFILDAFVWSFSRVNTYSTCPKSFKLQYIDCKSKVQNAFAEWGLLCHSILEGYFKGEISLFDMEEEYKKRYDEYVQHEFPMTKTKNMNISYYEDGLNYFRNFRDFGSNYEVLGIEQRLTIELGGYKFTGFIDLILRDKKDKKIIIVDHKSKSGFKNNDELSHYLLQLYLYSKYIYDTYGEFPKELWFNMFRAGNICKCTFDEAEYRKSYDWFVSTIKQIYIDDEFVDKVYTEYMKKGKDIADYKLNDYYCNNICSVREHCNRCKQGDANFAD